MHSYSFLQATNAKMSKPCMRCEVPGDEMVDLSGPTSRWNSPGAVQSIDVYKDYSKRFLAADDKTVKKLQKQLSVKMTNDPATHPAILAVSHNIDIRTALPPCVSLHSLSLGVFENLTHHLKGGKFFRKGVAEVEADQGDDEGDGGVQPVQGRADRQKLAALEMYLTAIPKFPGLKKFSRGWLSQNKMTGHERAALIVQLPAALASIDADGEIVEAFSHAAFLKALLGRRFV